MNLLLQFKLEREKKAEDIKGRTNDGLIIARFCYSCYLFEDYAFQYYRHLYEARNLH